MLSDYWTIVRVISVHQTYPSSGQAFESFLLAPYTPCLPLRGSVRRCWGGVALERPGRPALISSTSNAPDQKRGEISALHPAYAPVFCIWLLCAWQYLVSGTDDRENPLDLHDDWRNIATIKQAN
jgi:hypothetical protein